MNLGAHTKAINAGGTATTTPAIGTVNGSGCVVAVVWSTAQTFVSLTDSKGNSWIQIGGENIVTGGKIRLYYCTNLIGGPGHTFTMNLSGASAAAIFVVEILTDVHNGVSLDLQAYNADAVSPFTSPVIVPNAANVFLFAFDADDTGTNPATHTAGGGFAIADEIVDGSASWTGATGWQVVSSLGNYQSSWTELGVPTDTGQAIASFTENPQPVVLWAGGMI